MFFSDINIYLLNHYNGIHKILLIFFDSKNLIDLIFFPIWAVIFLRADTFMYSSWSSWWEAKTGKLREKRCVNIERKKCWRYSRVVEGLLNTGEAPSSILKYPSSPFPFSLPLSHTHTDIHTHKKLQKFIEDIYFEVFFLLSFSKIQLNINIKPNGILKHDHLKLVINWKNR